YSGGGGGDGGDFAGGGGGSYVDSSFSTVNTTTSADTNGFVSINGTDFFYTGAAKNYLVTTSGIYDIFAEGAMGGGAAGSSGGDGAAIEALGFLSAGTDLTIVVGGVGGNGDFAS